MIWLKNIKWNCHIKQCYKQWNTECLDYMLTNCKNKQKGYLDTVSLALAIQSEAFVIDDQLQWVVVEGFCVVVTGVGVFEFEGTTLYSCERCGKCYKYRSGLYKHTRYECGMDGQFQCPHCPYKAKQKSNLKIHVFAKHKPSKWQHPSTCYFPIKIFLSLLLACYSLFVCKINFTTK